MLRSMYSAISGLKNFQTKLDVIGNNIANVSTYGFKKGRATFQDLISQQVSGASAPTANRGGVNSIQVGLGTKVASIDTITTQGNSQTTGRPLDVAVSGDGYFIVNDGAKSYYTRAGNFYLDKDGSLVNSDGLFVQCFPLNGAGTAVDTTAAPTNLKISDTSIPGGHPAGTTITSFSIGPSGEIDAVLSDNTVQPLGQIALGQFANPEGLTKSGSNLFSSSGNSGNVTIGTAAAAGSSFQPGMLEMSNVDLSEEFTGMIEAQRGYQANARVITTADQILQELVNLKR